MTISRSGRILVVDDESVVRETLERFLRPHGYEFVVASHGQEALGSAALQRFEVVFLDIMMPGLSGMETLKELLECSPDTSVIMITGVAEMETAVKAMRLGAYDYVTKPFDMKDLLVRVEKAREKEYLAVQLKEYQKRLEEWIALQAKELRQMLTQTVHSLIKQELLEREVDAKGGKLKGSAPGTDIKQFGARILRRLGGSGT